VVLVEDQQADPVQRGVRLQAAGEDAFGDHFDARVRAYLAVQADAVTHGFTDVLAQLAGQTLGRRTRSEAPWLEHEDGLPGEPWLVQQRQRHAGGLAGAGRGLEHGFIAVLQGQAQGGQGGING